MTYHIVEFYVTIITASLVENRELEELLETIQDIRRLFYINYSDRIVKTLLSVC